ncbi:Tm-1-like ATP-binding domain-containing protein [Aeribacillus composti]|uniref:Tm-1-like ATP-binding domain-containing protein n=1 Tax=Aeribacillus composti TaxID=1868734 RepID=UPI002E1DCEB3|nr:Tm-1-like ATP-binding domain-containing protein [Aeribacillus composti]
MAAVVVIGTLDTKGVEHQYVSEIIRSNGCEVLLIDVGILGTPQVNADISREEVANAAGTSIKQLVLENDRGKAIDTMGNGVAKLVKKLYKEGRLGGVFALGGSGGSSIAARAMRELPIGVPKLIVSTIASGDTKPYVGQSDIMMMYSVVDIAGINCISKIILQNAANAIAGMVKERKYADEIANKEKPIVAISMFGVTTACVTEARRILENLGYEVIVFHANGSGGKAMESLIKDGFIDAVLDLTTTELADELVGGMLSAGPERLEIAGRLGIPQVVSLGALDMVNFGPVETIPRQYSHRKFYKHNSNVTLMRTNIEECTILGKRIAEKLNKAKGPVCVFIPLKGVSSIDIENGVFYDPEADKALFASLRESLSSHIEIVEMDVNINNPLFAQSIAVKLHKLYKNEEVHIDE